MRCPECGHGPLSVSYTWKHESVIIRRRKCSHCSALVRTCETFAEVPNGRMVKALMEQMQAIANAAQDLNLKSRSVQTSAQSAYLLLSEATKK